uniref:Uncharacterized protein n=1 Tax=Sciurus vulgaris TaxID=55149 RepID=A0A8D2AJZ5_SCIVU
FQNHREFGEITVWPPRKQRPISICFISFSSQISPQFPKDLLWFGASSVPALIFSIQHPSPFPPPTVSPLRCIVVMTSYAGSQSDELGHRAPHGMPGPAVLLMR